MKIMCFGCFKEVSDLLMEPSLIAFQAKNVMSTLTHDLFSNRFLAAHSIKGHHRTGNIELLQEAWDRCNLVRLTINFYLSKDQPVITRPGAHPMNGRFLRRLIKATSQRFSINRDHFTFGDLC